MWYSPALATLTLSGSTVTSDSGSGLKMLGSSTCTSCSSRGATTMKMMSNTSTTSTSGVTFMSGRTSARRRSRDPITPHLRAPGLAPSLECVRQLTGGGGQRALVGCHRGREVVEGEDGRDRDRETERRLDQRLGDACRHG